MTSSQGIFKHDAKTLQSKQVSEQKAILKTHESHTAVNLRGLSTPSPSTAWASGENGTFLRTVDSGKTWECKQVPNAEKLFFRDVKAFDEKTAYLMSSGEGDTSRIYKTADGGATWQLQLSGNNSEEFFDCMAFWNKDHGMVLSDPVDGKFKIYLTENGGTNWSPLPPSSMPAALKGEGAFAASGTCMTVVDDSRAWFGTGGNTARVFCTTDGAKSWQAVNTPIVQNSGTAGIYSIAFYDAKHGVISGGDYEKPDAGGANLAITEDGGITWNLAAVSPQYYWSAVSFSPDHANLMMVGTQHAGLTKSESPKLWDESWNVSLNALSFWSKNKALAVGPKGTIIEFDMPKKSM